MSVSNSGYRLSPHLAATTALLRQFSSPEPHARRALRLAVASLDEATMSSILEMPSLPEPDPARYFLMNHPLYPELQQLGIRNGMSFVPFVTGGSRVLNHP
jgi:hypothetical protein